jgi:type I restriction enzyme S subunit
LSILDSVTIRWPMRPFGRVAHRRREAGRSDLESLSVFLDDGVVPRGSRTDNFNALGADLDKYLVVQPGDIVFNKLRTWQGGLGASKYEGIVSPAYYVCRPDKGMEPQFLHYLLRSSIYLQELTRLSKFMPPSQFDLPWEQLKALPVPIPPLEEQRRIADFLDEHTTAIDGLMSLRNQQIRLIRERKALHFTDSVLRFDNWKPLKRFGAQVQVGIVVRPSQWYVDQGGVPAIRGLDISPGNIDAANLVQISDSGHQLNQKSRLNAGDLVVVRTGKAGAAAVVPQGLDNSNAIDVLIVRPGRNLDADFVELLINSEHTARFVEEFSVGSLQAHLNVAVLRELTAPGISLRDQRTVVAAVRRKLDDDGLLVEAMLEQQTLLTEHRQALITAAVTGQLDVTKGSRKVA